MNKSYLQGFRKQSFRIPQEREPGQVKSLPTGEQLPWKDSETEVKNRRSSSKKREKTPEPVSEDPMSPSSSGETIRLLGEQDEDHQPVFRETDDHVTEPVPQREEWVKTGQSIQFRDESQNLGGETPIPLPPAPTGESQPISTAAAAVDVLFDSSGQLSQTTTRKRITQGKPGPSRRSRLHRSRSAISSLVTSCFSTTRSIVRTLVALVVLTGALVTLGIGVVGLLWIILEDRPSPAFQSLTTSPQRMLSDSRKNGYFLLLGFDAPAGEDPLQAGYERKPGIKDAAMAETCLEDSRIGQSSFGLPKASTKVAAGWFRESDPVGQFESHQPTIKGWASQGESALRRYRQWQKLPFEDWGYGQTVSLPCTSILFAHRLYLAEGFIQKGGVGVDRLEADMEAWRTVLGRAKTLPVKTLALQAINDDVVVASGLLVRPDFGSEYLGRVTKMLRPLDQVELSMRWPMQSELVSASKDFESQVKAEKGLPATVAASLPLPKQRRLNSYAAYYEASYKAAGEGRYGSLPKWKNYIQFPAKTIIDYLTNPIENVVGVEPLASWDRYNGLVIDTDAHLRLASLQAWLRRGPQDVDLLPRIAKAGQRFYDPYTGLPMLVNLKKGVMYSVGHDGKDQDADPQFDVVVMIPSNRASATTTTASAGSSRSK